MILTVTANPLLDRMLSGEGFAWQRINRGQQVYELAGGKGVNVSRALLRLGHRTVATGFLGGYTGARIRQLLETEGIETTFLEIAATTRLGMTIRQPGQPLTAFYDPPHEITASQIERFIENFPTMLEAADFCVLAGSVPGDRHHDFLARLVRLCRQRGVPCLVDTYGKPLAAALSTGPVIVKPNRDEVRQALDLPDGTEPQILAFMHAQAQRGTKWIVVSDGAREALTMVDGELLRITPAPVQPISALGSGDCVAAGLVAGILENLPTEEIVRLAFAAGCANAEVWDPADIRRPRVEELARQIQITRA